jgi:hypothetical protein
MPIAAMTHIRRSVSTLRRIDSCYAERSSTDQLSAQYGIHCEATYSASQMAFFETQMAL